MNKIDGWKDQVIDQENDLIIILATNGNDLTAYSSKPTQLFYYKRKLKQYEIDLKKKAKEKWNEDKETSRRWDEFDEVIFAMCGNPVDLLTACEIFPYLKDKAFWVKESWASYNKKDYKEIFKNLKGSI